MSIVAMFGYALPCPHAGSKSRATWATTALAATAVCAVAPAAAVTVTFNDFSNNVDRALFQTNGSANFFGDRLRLVPDEQSKAGSAFLREGLFINRTADFSTDFRFQVSSQNNQPELRSDGLTFVIQGVGPGLLGKAGESLGYRETATPPFPYYHYAIEFDTHQNTATGDLSDNEVAITRTSAQGTTVVAARDLSAGPNPRPLLDNGRIKNVHIEYNFHGVDRLLSVFLSEDLEVPQLVLQTLLPDDLFHFGGNSTYLGFTAATGGGHANYDVLQWSYTVPQPGSVPLVGLALAALALTSGRRAARTPAV